MGSILIVDDDYITIDGIRQYVNWERCGVKEVYTAMSARRAKEIIEGKHDNLPESAFIFVGNIDEAIEKAKTLA